MIAASIAAFIGLLLLVLLMALLREESETDSDALRALLGLRSDRILPPPSVFERIFDTSDLDFVAAQDCQPLVSLLAIERRRLALLWLRTIKREAFAILAAHRKAVRHQGDVRQSSEIRLLFHVAKFCLLYLAASSWVRYRGAFRLRASVHTVRHLCEHLAQMRSLMMLDAGLTPSWEGVR